MRGLVDCFLRPLWHVFLCHFSHSACAEWSIPRIIIAGIDLSSERRGCFFEKKEGVESLINEFTSYSVPTPSISPPFIIHLHSCWHSAISQFYFNQFTIIFFVSEDFTVFDQKKLRFFHAASKRSSISSKNFSVYEI